MWLIYIFMAASVSFPLIILNAPDWVISLPTTVFMLAMILAIFGKASGFVEVLILLMTYGYNIIKPVLYIWALLVTIHGPQDTLAIVFYIVTALQAVFMIKNFIGTLLLLLSACFRR